MNGKFFSIFLFIIIINHLSAQVIYDQDRPLGYKDIVNLKSLNTIYLPQFDLSELKSNKKCDNCKIKPIGKVFNYNIDFKKQAKFITHKNEKIWYLRIKTSVGKAISINFSGMHLPRGAKLYLYSSDGKIIFGPITYRNNKQTGFLPTRYLETRDLIIEYHEPVNVKGNSFLLKDIIVYSLLIGDSQYCEVNINCEEGAAWQTEKKSVAKIVFTSGTNQYLCTGALISNTAVNNEPYFLTANHCISTNNEAQSAVFYFNYESIDCQGLNVNNGQTISGSALIATGSNSSNDYLDFTLLRLSVVPPSSYYPYYAGWSRVSDPNSIDSSVCIHHPSGDIKKITKDFDNPAVGSFSGYDANTHWHILDWELGTTEGGSSGSPLFNQNRRIIGDLTGGEASCDNNVNDYYAQFYQSWDKYSDSLLQLRFWLDPLGQNPIFLDGYDPYENYVYLPPITHLYGYATKEGIKIHWLPTDYSGDSLIYDDFELYDDFALSFPNWTQIDRDQGITWGIEGVQYENENYIGSFIVFNSKRTEPIDPQGWTAHSGNKMLVCFSTQPPDNPNDDWLISQQFECTAEHKFVFYARSVTDSFGLERIRVLVSQGSSSPSDFEVISQEPFEQVPDQWTKFVYDLSDYAGKQIYVAINVVSDNSFALLLDDISITNVPQEALKNDVSNEISVYTKAQSHLKKSELPKSKAVSLLGYRIFRNYEEIAFVDSTTFYYVDNNTILPAKYYVVAKYLEGSSAGSPEIEIKQYFDNNTFYDRNNSIQILPNPVVNGYFKVVLGHASAEAVISIYNIYGQEVYVSEFNNIKEKELYLPFLSSGVYIIKLYVLGESYTTSFVIL